MIIIIKFIKIKKNDNRNIFNNGSYLLKNINRNYLSQGITRVNNYYFITSYSKERKNSLLTIYDHNFNFYRQIKLNTNAHVGGITYDDTHNIVWITDKNGTINGHFPEDLLLNKVTPLKKYANIPVGLDLINYKNQPSVAYITYYQNKIYLGNFCLNKKGELISYNINNDGTIDLNSKKIIINKFERKTQGIAFYKNNIIVSSSYGRHLNSSIIVYKEKNGKYIRKERYLVNIPLMEQIVTDNDKIIAISESGSNYYQGKKGVDLIIINSQKINL